MISAAIVLTAALLGADTTTFDYMVGGVHVVQRITPNDDIVAVDLYLIGGAQQLTPKTAGIEVLALRAAEYGTTRYPGTEARHALARTGSEWLVDPRDDWTMVGFRGVADQFDSSWVAFADRIVQPTLDSTAVARTREQMTRESRVANLTAEEVAWTAADSVSFGGYPYSLRVTGTPASLAGLTPDAVRRYVRDEFVTSRMLLVVVGNVSRARLEPLVAATLGMLPAGQYSWSPPPEPPPHAATLLAIERRTPTNYIVGYYTGPSVRNRDYAAFQLATQILGARVSGAVRSRFSLSYAAGAEYIGRGVSSGALYASTSQPSIVLALMHQQLDTARQNALPDWILKNFVKSYTLGHLMARETNATQAAALARAQLYFGDYRKADAEMDMLRAVTPDDLPRVAKQYMHLHFIYVGDTTRIHGDWVDKW